MDVRGIAAGIGYGALERGILLLAGFQVVIDHEHQFRPARGEGLSAAGLPGLDQHRMTLRRAWHAERAARLETLPGVIQTVDFAGSAKRLPSLSRISASSSHVFQWPMTTSMNSSARS